MKSVHLWMQISLLIFILDFFPPIAFDKVDHIFLLHVGFLVIVTKHSECFLPSAYFFLASSPGLSLLLLLHPFLKQLDSFFFFFSCKWTRYLYFFICGAKDRIQALTHARWARYHWASAPASKQLDSSDLILDFLLTVHSLHLIRYRRSLCLCRWFPNYFYSLTFWDSDS